MTPDLWKYERKMLINHVRALLLNDPQARRRALDYLIEVFEDEGLENVEPSPIPTRTSISTHGDTGDAAAHILSGSAAVESVKSHPSRMVATGRG